MKNYIVRDNSPHCHNSCLVGNKAVSLAHLKKTDNPIPPFFVVTTAAFMKFFSSFVKAQVKQNQNLLLIDHKIVKSYLDSLQFGCKEMPEKFWQEFQNEIDAISTVDSKSKTLYVVRSSSPFEDQSSLSFAGQFGSTSEVTDMLAIWDAVKKCWLSLWNPSVHSYLSHFNQNRAELSMAVIIQKMVIPTLSGVLFTQEPVSGDNSLILIEMVSDSTNGVESGQGEPERYYIEKGSNDSNKNGNVIVSAKSSVSDNCCLNEKQLLDLVNRCREIEDYFQSAQDIEWAFDNEKLWIIQARPMTTDIDNDIYPHDSEGDICTDYFFTERFMEPVTPLGWSIIGKWIEKRAFREPLYFFGFDDLSHHSHLICLIKFKPVTKLKVFQSLYSVLPESLISPDKRKTFFPDGRNMVWWWQVMLSLPYLIPRLLLRDYNWIPNVHLYNWQKFLGFYQLELQKKKKLIESLNLRDFKNYFLEVESLTDKLLSYHRWSITFADLFFHLLDKLVHYWAPECKNSISVDLVSGLHGNKTVEANIELAQLGDKLAELKKVNIGNGKESGDFDAHGIFNNPDLKFYLQKFLDKHGHRSKSLDLYHPTWNDDHQFVIKMISEFSLDIKARDKLVENRGLVIKARLGAESTINSIIESEGGIPAFIKKFIFKNMLKMAREFTLLRENQRYYWHMALAEKRRIIIEFANRIIKQNLLSDTELIFFLTRSEFLHCFESYGKINLYKELLISRHKQWKQAYLDLKPCNKNEIFNKDLQILKGVGVSSGQVQAIASIVSSLEEAQKVSFGTILVTRSIDPAWTPVFSKIAGLVLEVGGVLSHPAIIAREFRLPAVTSVPNATSRIIDGQIIYIDGQKGTVKVVSN